jgi:hypothetical protein
MNFIVGKFASFGSIMEKICTFASNNAPNVAEGQVLRAIIIAAIEYNSNMLKTKKTNEATFFISCYLPAFEL